VTILVVRGGLRKADPARQPHHQIAALVHAAIFGSKRRVLHPFLKAGDALVMTLLDLGADTGVGEERLRCLHHGWCFSTSFTFSTHLTRRFGPGSEEER